MVIIILILGGNAIQFAKNPSNHVIAIDNDITQLKAAQTNAKIYKVQDRITFILGSFYELLGNSSCFFGFKNRLDFS